VVREAQALDVVKEKVADAARDSFSGVCGQTAGKERQSAFEGGESQKAQSDPEEGLGEIVSDVLALSQDIIGEVAKQHVGERFGKCRASQCHCGAQVGETVIRHHLPQTLEAILLQGLAEVEGQSGFQGCHLHFLFSSLSYSF
jgi:hypothetical protein